MTPTGDVSIVITAASSRDVLFAPHNDDETLFAAYTIIRYRPCVVVCFRPPVRRPSAPSRRRHRRALYAPAPAPAPSRSYGPPELREAESRAACEILGAAYFEQWDCLDEAEVARRMRALDQLLAPAGRVWAPSLATTHPEHQAVARAAALVFGDRLVRYHTYTATERVQRVQGEPVPREPHYVARKLRALAAYTSQASHPNACVFFEQAQAEFYDDAVGKAV